MKQHILVVSQVYPYPLHDGGRFDIYNRLKALDELGYTTTLIAFYNPALAAPELEPLKTFCKTIYTLPYLRRKLSKIFHFKPYSIASRENDAAIQTIVEKLAEKNIDFVFILAESHHVLTVARQLKRRFAIPKLYLRSHNNEPRFILSVAQASPRFSLMQVFFLIEAVKYRLYENVLMKKFDAGDEILHISHDEWERGKTKYPTISHRFLPAGIDLSTQQPFRPSEKKNVLFAGALFSPNNLQGLAWYLRHVHPLVAKKILHYRLIIAGNTRGANPKEIEEIFNADTRITFYDTPKDLLPIYKESQLFINPMRYGAGVKLKTLDAMLKGLPVVATSIGNEGTGLTPNKHILVADQPADFEAAVCTLLLDQDARQKIVAHSQSFLKANYDQEKSLKKIVLPNTSLTD